MTDEALTGVREEQSRSCHSPKPPAVWETHALIYYDYKKREREGEVRPFLCVIEKHKMAGRGKGQKLVEKTYTAWVAIANSIY